MKRAVLPVRVKERDLLIVRDANGLHACERTCPHEQADLALGRCANGRLLCPRHLAWFDLADGSVSPGWRIRSLRIYRLRERHGQVEIFFEDEGTDQTNGSAD